MALLEPQSLITFRSVSKAFSRQDGTDQPVLSNLNLEIQPGEFCAVVGPTGCGKSTTLNLIAGLEQPTSGEVLVMGQPVAGIHPQCGYMFQSDATFPWKSVLDNIAAGLIFRGASKQVARLQASEWVKRVGLGGFERHYPHQLSGGMKKRMAMAQSLITGPKILLMDEPFSALDVQTRALMENELLSLWSETRASVLFVTHDLEEAIALADKVFVLSAGPGSTLKATYQIDLPRPRNVAEVKFDPAFVRIYQQIWEDLKSEVLISYERQQRKIS
jgi:NitT/TauT family transport system ATP-binding protein